MSVRIGNKIIGNAVNIDSTLSTTSSNAVQNKVVKQELDTKANTSLSNLSSTGQAIIDGKVSKNEIWYDDETGTLYIGVTQS